MGCALVAEDEPKRFKVLGNVNIVVRDVGETEKTIDLVLAYKILKFIYENKDRQLGIKEIAREGNFSIGTVDKYIKNLALLGLVKINKVGRKHVTTITEKGIEYLLLMERVLGLIRARL